VARALVPIGIAAALALTASNARAFANLLTHPAIAGRDIAAAEVRSAGGTWSPVSWSDLAHTTVEPGRYEVRVQAASDEAGDAIQVPPCAGRGAVRVDRRAVGDGPGPIVVPVAPGAHEVVIPIDVSRYERRIACGEPVRIGLVGFEETVSGLGTLVFESPHAARGGGKAVVYVPPGRDIHTFGKVLVGLHPWNGGIWTYAAYEELLREARARGVLLLMPSGLGNSLYTADAEDEVLRAIDALKSVVIVPWSLHSVHGLDVSLWGASMGGAGATTIGFHHPDRFASITSLFGDSSYDLSTYVRSILKDAHAAHLVNALDVVDNARNVPVWLIHGEDDTTSPIRQSEILATALQQRGFPVKFDRVPGFGHSGALVARFLPDIVAAAATTPTNNSPSRITYRSVRATDVDIYGLHMEHADPSNDAFIDLELGVDGFHVHRIDNVREIPVHYGWGSCRKLPPVFFDNPASAVPIVAVGNPCP
jgi:enterochelin esterase-like enzyme